jgi:mannose-6-phosphate isomerase-like protein (cupin superfamily)
LTLARRSLSKIIHLPVDRTLYTGFRLLGGFPALCLGAFSLSVGLSAATLNQAVVTKVVRDVRLLGAGTASNPATVDTRVDNGTVLRTGLDSWAELTFANESLARLASNTAFSFNGTRQLDLNEGAVLLQLPKKAHGAQVQAAGLAAVVTGTTVVFEYHPAVFKFFVLEGTARLYRPGHLGDSILVKPGQMVIGKPDSPLSDPVDFDIGRFLKTSRFISDFAPLGSESLMAAESQKQERRKSKKTLIETNLVIFGGGTNVSLVDSKPAEAHPNPAPQAAAPAATPTLMLPTIDSAVIDRAMTIRR